MNEPYLDWLDYILIQKTIPQTISTSYGDDEQTVPRDYATSVCNMFAQLGVMGVSILFGSGDGGVGGAGVVSGTCLSNDGKNRTEFLPMFPASCVCYSVSVTNARDLLYDDRKVPSSRQSVAQLKSIQRWQPASRAGDFQTTSLARPIRTEPSLRTLKVLMASILASLSAFVCFDKRDPYLLFTDTALSTAGRGYPDISAQAINFQIVLGGQVAGINGTSCSTPVRFPTNTIPYDPT